MEFNCSFEYVVLSVTGKSEVTDMFILFFGEESTRSFDSLKSISAEEIWLFVISSSAFRFSGKGSLQVRSSVDFCGIAERGSKRLRFGRFNFFMMISSDFDFDYAQTAANKSVFH